MRFHEGRFPLQLAMMAEEALEPFAVWVFSKLFTASMWKT